tara:strand:+ start:172 stop:315 length:144 start_codon:yes stop_codon:yes gene_type:complete
MSNEQKAWARHFTGTIREFIAQAQKRNFTDKSIKYWIKYNWNIKEVE